MQNLLENLNSSQKNAVVNTEGPVLILAGAGSGKTRVITYRIAYLMSELYVPAENILAITFTNKAAKEMRDRALNLIDGDASPTLCTFHSLGYTILKNHAQVIGYRKHIRISDADDSAKRLKRICKELHIDKENVPIIADMISKAKDQLMLPKDCSEKYAETEDPLVRYFVDVYKEYQAELKKDNMADFDDLIMLPVLAFRKSEDTLSFYQDRYRYIMVDEYQDTSHAQMELVTLLAERYKNICVVGDDYQSIYKFRGADITNILNFEKVYPEAVVVTLPENYRSTQEIVDRAARLIRNNPDQIHKELLSMQDKGDEIHIQEFADSRTEAIFVAEDIKRRLQNGENVSDIAVLYRKNAFSRSIEDALLRARIPYVIYGGISFYQRKEIKDMMAYLAMLTPVPDDISFERIVNIPKRGVGKKTIENIRSRAVAEGITMYEAAKNDNNKGVKEFIDLIERFKLEVSKPEMTIREIIDFIISETDYDKHLLGNAVKSDKEDDYSERKDNLGELISKASEFSKEHPKMNLQDTICEFLSEISLLTDQDMSDEKACVSLMSIHRSKGLEFETVYIVGCEDGQFPGICNTPEDIYEERRLCYVGMTRAKRNLYMSWCDLRYLYGQEREDVRSRFLDELEENLGD